MTFNIHTITIYLQYITTKKKGADDMQQVTSDIMTFRGSHFELGVKTGKWLQQTPLLKNREKEWKKRVPRFDIDVNETYQIRTSNMGRINGTTKYTQNANTPNYFKLWTLSFYRFKRKWLHGLSRQRLHG